MPAVAERQRAQGFDHLPTPQIDTEREQANKFNLTAGESVRKRRRAKRKLARQNVIAERLKKIHDRSYPNEEEMLEEYSGFVNAVKNGESTTLRNAVEFARKWNDHPYYVHRRVEEDLRKAAKETDRNPGKLKRRKFSSLKNSLEILGLGKIPTTSKQAKTAIDDRTDPTKVGELSELHEQLARAEKMQGRKGGGVVFEIGVGLGWGPIGTQTNIGGEITPRNPDTGRRSGDAFVAQGGRLTVFSSTGILGFRKHGREKSVTAAGLALSKGNPYHEDQARIKPPLVGVTVGKRSGIVLEAPLLFFAPIATLVGAHDIASQIHALGDAAYFIKPQVVINLQDERLRPLQEGAAKALARAPRLPKLSKVVKRFQRKEEPDKAVPAEAPIPQAA